MRFTIVKGTSLYDDDAIRLFREKAREHFNGFEFADKDRAVRARMQDYCVPIGRGIWKLDKHEILIPTSLIRRIEQCIIMQQWEIHHGLKKD